MTPSQIKRHVFPPKRKIANFFGCLGYLLVWFYPKILIDLVFFSLSMFCFFIVKCFIKLRTVWKWTAAILPEPLLNEKYCWKKNLTVAFAVEYCHG